MKQIFGSTLLQLIVGALLKAFVPESWGLSGLLSWSSYTVIGLFLMVGLQIHLKKFAKDLGLCAKLVLVTTLVPMMFFYSMGVGFDLDHLGSLTVAVVLTTTGTGVTIQTLLNLGMLHSRAGQFLTLVSALDDIPATMFMTYLLFQKKTEVVAAASANSGLAVYLMAGAVVSFGLIFLVRNRWGLSLLFLAFSICVAKFLEGHQISAVMGGLFSGFILSLILGEKRVEATERPLDKMLKPLLPFYMIFIGMKLSPEILLNKRALFMSLSLLVVAVISKFVCTYYLMREREDLNPLVIAWGMVPRGIPGFAFASASVAGGLISQETFTILVLVVSVSTWIGLLGLEVTLRKR